MNMLEYSEFMKKALKACSGEEEKARITDEFELIEKRGWEKYMVLVADIFDKTRGLDWHIMSGGMLKHSCSLSRVLNPEKEPSYILRKSKDKVDFFSENLEYGYFCIRNWKTLENYLRFKKIGKIIHSLAGSSGLYVRSETRKESKDKMEVILISTSPIPDEDVKSAFKVHDTRTPEEKERLMNHLLFTLSSNHTSPFLEWRMKRMGLLKRR